MAVAAERRVDPRLPGHRSETRPAPAMRFSFRSRQLDIDRQCGPAVTFAALLSPAACPGDRPEPGADSASRVVPGADPAAMAAFLADSVRGAVPPATLARMIGCCAFACGAVPAGGLDVTLSNRRGTVASVRLDRPRFEAEQTAFGAAHVLHEDETLGLYVLEIAPGHSIPAHSHRVMREWELILDDGLLLQGRPVPRGAAFAWPLGHVHGYGNPTPRPLRILCIDSPRFDPADEVPLDPSPPLVPRAPFAEYPV